MFDLTVNLGNLLTILSFLTGGVAFVVTLRNMIRSLNQRMSSVEIELKKLTDVLIKLAGYDERFRGYDERFMRLENEQSRIIGQFDELRHGEGFVVTNNRRAN